MQDNKVRIHLISPDFYITSQLIIFKIANESIGSIELIVLDYF